MPVHDWTRVDAGIFHDFHHAWIEDIKRTLNAGLLPDGYYALAEQHAAGFGPDVLTLQGGNGNGTGEPQPPGEAGGLKLAAPGVRFVGETTLDFYRRKQSALAVRHVSGDRIVAMVEIVSPGNKSSRSGLATFVTKAVQLLERQVHLLILDLFPPGPRDPSGIHAALWEELTGETYVDPSPGPLTLASYDASPGVRAYVETVAVGDALVDMPLFLEPRAHVEVPLEATYQAAWLAVPRRWRAVLEK